MKKIALSVDVEEDCPPMLKTMKGIEGGLPKLLDLFQKEKIKATFFVTGRMAELYPDLISRIPAEGHELGCHGYSHARFDRMNQEEAGYALQKAVKVLRGFDAGMLSFRAPNLKLPEKYLILLEKEGFRYDASTAKYKPPFQRGISVSGKITRVPASITSSFLRLPLPLVIPVLGHMENPVLFVHPWEFIDMSETPIRPDCKFNTGEKALTNLTAIIRHFRSENYSFLTIREMAASNSKIPV